jgi:hypothetical protein
MDDQFWGSAPRLLERGRFSAIPASTLERHSPMNLLVVRLGISAFFMPCIVLAQGEKPCFAFLLRGDVSISCEGRVTQITRLGDVDEFAVSSERSALGYTTSADAGDRNAVVGIRVSTTTLVDLHSGMTRHMAGDDYIVNTCGGLFWGHEGMQGHSGTHELISGKELAEPPYNWFRCSADRGVVVGTRGDRGSDLYEGVPPRTKIAAAGSFFNATFSVSPNGSYVAYSAGESPVCVASLPAAQQCAPESGTPDSPSVDDSGQVLFTTSTPQECFYKSSSNFSPRRLAGPTNTDVCLAVGYWRPGLKSVEIVAPLGRNPQWLSPATAEILRSWAARPVLRKNSVRR